MKKVILSFLYSLGLHRVFKFVFRRKLLVLAYHGFRRDEAAGSFAPFWGTHVIAAKFEEQLCYLKKYYTPVSLESALDALGGGPPLSDNAVVVTIDDGYQSIYEIAFPLLKKYSIPATVFITTGFVDNEILLWVDRLVYSVLETKKETLEVTFDGRLCRYDLRGEALRQSCVWDLNARLKAVGQYKRESILAEIEERLACNLAPGGDVPEPMRPLSWDQAREMQKSGLVTFGAHTRTHLILSRCSVELCRSEVRYSKERVEQELQAACRFFAYPNGGEADYSEVSGLILSEEGFLCAFVSVPGLVRLRDDLLTLKRVPVLNWMDQKAFALQIALIVPALRRLKDGFRKGAGCR